MAGAEHGLKRPHTIYRPVRNYAWPKDYVSCVTISQEKPVPVSLSGSVNLEFITKGASQLCQNELDKL
jgi:hypothetical protein